MPARRLFERAESVRGDARSRGAPAGRVWNASNVASRRARRRQTECCPRDEAFGSRPDCGAKDARERVIGAWKAPIVSLPSSPSGSLARVRFGDVVPSSGNRGEGRVSRIVEAGMAIGGRSCGLADPPRVAPKAAKELERTSASPRIQPACRYLSHWSFAECWVEASRLSHTRPRAELGESSDCGQTQPRWVVVPPDVRERMLAVVCVDQTGRAPTADDGLWPLDRRSSHARSGAHSKTLNQSRVRGRNERGWTPGYAPASR